MKKVAIIGTGLSALRAGLELAGINYFALTFLDKAPGFGGRLATRRFGENYVNHGAEAIHGWERVMIEDEKSHAFSSYIDNSNQVIKGRASDLPKAIIKTIEAIAPDTRFLKEHKIGQIAFIGQKVILKGKIKDNEEYEESFDYVLVSSPLPQTNEMLDLILPLNISYNKSILFIGQENEQTYKFALDQTLANEKFDSSDEELFKLGVEAFGEIITRLQLKKWRYATVRSGETRNFYQVNPRCFVVGEAFDLYGRFGAGAAWTSGLRAAQAIINEQSR